MKARTLTLALLVMALPAPSLAQAARPGSGPSLSRSALYVSAAADFASTRIGIARGNVELNPILGQHWARQAAFVFGSTVGVDLVSRKLEREGHPRLAQVIRFVSIGTHGFAVTWNLNQPSRRR